MKLYRLHFECLSPFTTQVNSYTLFGAFCWGYRLLRGEEALKELLERFKSEPPFLISSPVFSAYDTLFYPCPQMIDKFSEPESEEKYKFQKEIKKIASIPKEALIEFLNGKINTKEELGNFLLEKGYIEKENENSKEKWKIKSAKFNNFNRVRNSLNRLTLSTSGGGDLINVTCYYHPKFVVYLLILDEGFDVEIFKGIYNLVSLGGDKSIGYGRVKVSLIDEEKELVEFTKPISNHIYLLSPSFPDKSFDYENKDTLYQISIYCGFIENFYERLVKFIIKKRVFYLDAGSQLVVKVKKSFYGSLYPVAQNKEITIYQYGYGFPLYKRVVS
jgi:CRISPR-associated protein Csm4